MENTEVPGTFGASCLYPVFVKKGLIKIAGA